MRNSNGLTPTRAAITGELGDSQPMSRYFRNGARLELDTIEG